MSLCLAPGHGCASHVQVSVIGWVAGWDTVRSSTCCAFRFVERRIVPPGHVLVSDTETWPRGTCPRAWHRDTTPSDTSLDLVHGHGPAGPVWFNFRLNVTRPCAVMGCVHDLSVSGRLARGSTVLLDRNRKEGSWR